MRQLDLIGQRFGKLVVMLKVDPIRKHSAFLCKCDCGEDRIVIGCRLKLKQVYCCGCSDGDARKKVKHLNRRLYEVWKGMKARCRDKKHVCYKNYGGRGIQVCEEWAHDFVSFHNWAIGNGYKEGLTIDRIDNDGGYSPSNCQWVTMKENSRKTRRLKLNYKKVDEIRKSNLPHKELAKIYNVHVDTIQCVKRGQTWS